MASRGSPARRVPGNALAGVLRDNARRARSTTVRGSRVPGPAGAPGADGTAGATGVAQTAQLVSAVGGSITWTFATPFATPPAVVATAGSGTLVTVCTIASTSATAVAVRVWQQAVAGGAFALTAGVVVNLVALPL